MDNERQQIQIDFDIKDSQIQESCEFLESAFATAINLSYGGLFRGDCYFKVGQVDFSLLDGRDDNEPFAIAWFLATLASVADYLHRNVLETYTWYSLDGQFCYGFRSMGSGMAEIRDLFPNSSRLATFETLELLIAAKLACTKLLDMVLTPDRGMSAENENLLRLYLSSNSDEFSRLEDRLVYKRD